MPTILVYENITELYNISNSKSSFTVSNTFRYIFTSLCCFFYYIFFDLFSWCSPWGSQLVVFLNYSFLNWNKSIKLLLRQFYSFVLVSCSLEKNRREIVFHVFLYLSFINLVSLLQSPFISCDNCDLSFEPLGLPLQLERSLSDTLLVLLFLEMSSSF